MNFESILNQVFQPYFYYSVIFLVLSFVCVKVLTKYCNFLSQKTKSLLFLVPLAVPLIVMFIFMPSTVIQNNPFMKTGSFDRAVNGFGTSGFLPPLQSTSGAFVVNANAAWSTVISVTGILCLAGLLAGGFFALSMLAADDRIARKVLHVIPLAPSEPQWLQIKVGELSKKLAIATPKIGLVEDLRPNAFTIGYAENSTIVFSIGLLNILDKEEVIAVASHELAHVKNYDFFYKTASSALTVVSFFNPLAYITSSMGQREREMLADEKAVQLVEKPAALGNAIAKICKAIQNLPRESMLMSFSSNLLVTSSVLHRIGILSTHPRLDKRLRNISEPKMTSRWNNRRIGFAFFLSLLLITSAIAVSGALVNLQVGFTASQQAKLPTPPIFNGTAYQIPGHDGTLVSGPIIVPYGVVHVSNGSMRMSANGIDNQTVVLMVDNGSYVAAHAGSVNSVPFFASERVPAFP